MDKDTVYHELYNRLEGDQCPICRMVLDRTDKAMDSFLYESVNLPEIRIRIRKDRGFCKPHSHRLREKGDPLAHAIVYQELIEDAMARLDNGQKEKKEPMFGKKESPCFFCRQEEAGDLIYARAVLQYMDQPQFLERYQQAGRLCLPHLKSCGTFAKKNDPRYEQLKQTTFQKYQEFLKVIAEIRRKCDYRYVHEIWTEEEKEFWKYAVDIFIG